VVPTIPGKTWSPTGASAGKLKRQLCPDLPANKQAYPRIRDHLLTPYRGRWMVVQDRKVIASGPGLMGVMEKGSAACISGPQSFMGRR
jgi:hypothetical protein